MSEPAYLSFYLGSDTIYIFCSVLKRMGRPTYVRFLIDADTMRLAMQPFHKKEFTSFRVPKALYVDRPGKHVSFRIHSRAFCQLVAVKMGWNADRSYRIPGTVYSKCSTACFDLTGAKEIHAGGGSIAIAISS